MIAYLALFLALGGSAYAVGRPAGSSARIDACYDVHSGDLRIPLGRKCRSGERPIAWNVQGGPGPQGQAGPQGLAGPQGEPGSEGKTGATGTVDTSTFFDKTESDARYLPVAGTAADSSLLSGQPSSAFASSSLFGSPVPAQVGGTAITPPCYLGQILLFAGTKTPGSLHLADGSLVPIALNTALFSLIGTEYGGNGTTNFALPDLRAASPKGAGNAGVNYYICVAGIFPS